MQIMNNGFIKGKDKPHRPSDLFKLEGDPEVKERTREEMIEHYEFILKRWQLKRN